MSLTSEVKTVFSGDATSLIDATLKANQATLNLDGSVIGLEGTVENLTQTVQKLTSALEKSSAAKEKSAKGSAKTREELEKQIKATRELTKAKKEASAHLDKMEGIEKITSNIVNNAKLVGSAYTELPKKVQAGLAAIQAGSKQYQNLKIFSPETGTTVPLQEHWQKMATAAKQMSGLSPLTAGGWMGSSAGIAIKTTAEELDNLKPKLDDAKKGFTDTSQAIMLMVSALGLVKLKQFAEEAIRAYENAKMMGTAMHAMGSNIGHSSMELDGLEGSMRKSNISIQTSRGSLARWMEAGLKMTDLMKVMKMSQDLSVVGMMSSSEAMEHMILGIITRYPRMLRQFGIGIEQQPAYDKYAASIHKTSETLTDLERTQAFANAALAYGPKVVGVYSKSLSDAGRLFKELSSTVIPDFLVAIGQKFTPIVSAATQTLYNFLKAETDAPGIFTTLTAGLTSFGVALLGIVTSIKLIQIVWPALQAMFTATAGTTTLLGVGLGWWAVGIAAVIAGVVLLTSAFGVNTEEISKNASKHSELITLLDKAEKGMALDAEEVKKLTTAFPQLTDKIDKSGKVMKGFNDELKRLKDITGDQLKAAIIILQNEVEKAGKALEATKEESENLKTAFDRWGENKANHPILLFFWSITSAAKKYTDSLKDVSNAQDELNNKKTALGAATGLDTVATARRQVTEGTASLKEFGPGGKYPMQLPPAIQKQIDDLDKTIKTSGYAVDELESRMKKGGKEAEQNLAKQMQVESNIFAKAAKERADIADQQVKSQEALAKTTAQERLEALNARDEAAARNPKEMADAKVRSAQRTLIAKRGIMTPEDVSKPGAIDVGLRTVPEGLLSDEQKKWVEIRKKGAEDYIHLQKEAEEKVAKLNRGTTAGKNAAAYKSTEELIDSTIKLEDSATRDRIEKQKKFVSPMSGTISPHGGFYDTRGHGQHNAGDIFPTTGVGTAVQAPTDLKITNVRDAMSKASMGGGGMVWGIDDDGVMHKFIHVKPGMGLKEGDKIKAGQEIATLSDIKSGAHLHYGQEKGGVPIDWMAKAGLGHGSVLQAGIPQLGGAGDTGKFAPLRAEARKQLQEEQSRNTAEGLEKQRAMYAKFDVELAGAEGKSLKGRLAAINEHEQKSLALVADAMMKEKELYLQEPSLVKEAEDAILKIKRAAALERKKVAYDAQKLEHDERRKLLNEWVQLTGTDTEKQINEAYRWRDAELESIHKIEIAQGGANQKTQAMRATTSQIFQKKMQEATHVTVKMFDDMGSKFGDVMGQLASGQKFDAKKFFQGLGQEQVSKIAKGMFDAWIGEKLKFELKFQKNMSGEFIPWLTGTTKKGGKLAGEGMADGFDKVQDGVKDTKDGVEKLGDSTDKTSTGFSKMESVAVSVFKKIGSALSSLWDKLKNVLSGLGGVGESAAGAAEGLGGVGEGIGGLNQGGMAIYGNSGLMAFRMAAQGEHVPGVGSHDTVPYMLTPGEYVNTQGAVNKYGVKFFDSLNRAAGGYPQANPLHPMSTHEQNNSFHVSVPLNVSQMPANIDVNAMQADIERSVITVMRGYLR